MLEFIKKFRNCSNRTVVTLKCKKSFYILKRKDILNETKDIFGCKCEAVSGGETKSCTLNGDFAASYSEITENEPSYAFKGSDIARCVDECGSLNFEGCGYDASYDYNANKTVKGKKFKDSNVSSEKAKFVDKKKKGAYVCEKTYRFLLCDVIAAFATVLSLLCFAKWLLRKR